MNTRKFVLSLFVALAALVSSALAQTTQTQATVAKVTGTASVTMPDGSTVALTQGMKVPQGATITTGADGDVFLESHAGYVTSIKQGSVVTVDEISVTSAGGKVQKENTTLDLKSGNLVAMLDPKKKSVNNYQVRTPKGVAAARGTIFTVMVRGQNYRISVVNGTVTLTSPSDGAVLTIGQGNLAANGIVGDWANPDENSDAALTQSELAIVVATVAVAAANNIGGTTTAEFQSVLTAVVQAAPAAAAAIQAAVNLNAPTLSNTTSQTITNVAPDAPTTPPPGVTPQPIDPGTVSRSG